MYQASSSPYPYGHYGSYQGYAYSGVAQQPSGIPASNQSQDAGLNDEPTSSETAPSVDSDDSQDEYISSQTGSAYGSYFNSPHYYMGSPYQAYGGMTYGRMTYG